MKSPKQDLQAPRRYTNRKDWNGKDMYEGDIVKAPFSEELGEIVCVDDVFRVVPITGKWGGTLDWFEDLPLKVIGNKYEHPELLTKK